jgi:hypothetical protein
MLVMVAVWTLFPIAFGTLEATGLYQPSLLVLTVATGLAWFTVAGIGAAMGEALLRSLTGRYVAAPTAVIVVGSCAIIAYFLNQDPASHSSPEFVHRIVNLHFLLFFTAMATLNSFYDWRLIVSSAAYLAAFVAGFLWPDKVFWFMAASNFVALGWAGRLIHRRSLEIAKEAQS